MGLIPKGGYRRADKQSRKALLWMKYLETNYPFHIRYAGNGREYRLPELPNLKVDGFCENKEVFSFNGCFYHGYHCLRNRDVPIIGSTSETLEDRYNRTMARLDQIVSAGYVCHVMWECEFDRILKENPALEKCDNDEPIILRNSLYGGRTEATKLYCKTGDKTRIKYFDIMSLYPYICKYFKFPIGHPKSICRK
jgi:G:T-mismatch repair DNA endonuclease (very short patch repair protein)